VVGVRKKKHLKKNLIEYVKNWKRRGKISNKLWKSKDKKLKAKWEKRLKNMPADEYEKLFPDAYHWVKKFAMGMMKKPKRKNGKRGRAMKKVKMWRVCQRMKFKGVLKDFSMWACLFGDLAFTKVSIEELESLKPYMHIEIAKFRREHKWWPHPAVLLTIARTAMKQDLSEVNLGKKKNQGEKLLRTGDGKGTKRKADMMERGAKNSGYKHVFWHGQSDCWRALVKKKQCGGRCYEHFDSLKQAVQAASKGLKIPVCELKIPGEGADVKTASLYKGVFYDDRGAYQNNQNKWMAVIWVKKPGQSKKVWKGLGHHPTQILAAKRVARAKKCELKELRQKKQQIYATSTAMNLAEQRFILLSDVFVNNMVGGKKVPANPPDYEKSEMVMKSPQHKKMFREEPAMEDASIGLKYGPSKDDLLLEWKKTQQRSLKYWRTLAGKLGLLKNVRPDMQKKVYRKLRIMVTLQGVAKKLHKKDCLFWVRNAGRYVSKHLGPVMFLSTNGVIQKISKKKKKKTKKKQKK